MIVNTSVNTSAPVFNTSPEAHSPFYFNASRAVFNAFNSLTAKINIYPIRFFYDDNETEARPFGHD